MSQAIRGRKFLFLVALVLLAGFFSAALVRIQPFGEPEASVVDDHYLARAQTESRSNDLVTAVAYDYRSLDVLVLAASLFVVSISVVSLLQGGGRR